MPWRYVPKAQLETASLYVWRLAVSLDVEVEPGKCGACGQLSAHGAPCSGPCHLGTSLVLSPQLPRMGLMEAIDRSELRASMEQLAAVGFQ